MKYWMCFGLVYSQCAAHCKMSLFYLNSDRALVSQVYRLSVQHKSHLTGSMDLVY